MKLVEQIGSGIRRRESACSEHGIGEPATEVSPDWLTVTFPRSIEAVSPHVTHHVVRLIGAEPGEMNRAALMNTLGLLDRRNFVATYLQPALDVGLVEMTLPHRPKSRSKRYQLTAQGSQVQVSQRGNVRMSNNQGWLRNSYTGHGGGLYTGPSPYYSNIPPREVYLEYLRMHGYHSK